MPYKKKIFGIHPPFLRDLALFYIPEEILPEE
jgi:hypothetical protein